MAQADAPLEAFRTELIDWLQANCPASLRPGETPTQEDRDAWQQAYTGKGYTTPTWSRMC